MEKSCFNCKYYDQPSFEMKEYCWECLRQEEVYTRWERKPITNADFIRAMSDEELATLLTNVAKKSAEKLCENLLKIVDVNISNCDFDILYKKHLDWLKKENE